MCSQLDNEFMEVCDVGFMLPVCLAASFCGKLPAQGLPAYLECKLAVKASIGLTISRFSKWFASEYAIDVVALNIKLSKITPEFSIQRDIKFGL